MRKQEFLNQLRAKLIRLPQQDVEEHVLFYREMIEDRIEEGRTEEEAVLEIGSVDDIAMQIIGDIALVKIAKGKMKPKRRLKTWEIVLLAVGSPIWLSLAIAAFAVVLSLYVVLWSLVISIWAIFVSLCACAIGGVIVGIIFAGAGNTLTGIAMMGTGILCAGLAIFLFFGCKAATKGFLALTKKTVLGIKKSFIKKEIL